MMPLPEKFDANEWFIVLFMAAAYTAVFLLPRRFPAVITAVMLLLSDVIAKAADFIIATPPYDLYDITDTPKFDLFDFILWLLYPPFGYLALYIYDKFHIRGTGAALYVLICSLLALGFEWLAAQAHVFNYKGWTTVYSLPVYLFVISLYLLIYRLLQQRFRILKHTDASAGAGPYGS
ncbi:hypothetical protein KP806_02925 [Paenibacillus sp. N4]|uniref:hypothetical protein n=1 Tax=Paenibacillus vietnamensis TaxID=2590547 RepID=UPI001CD0E6F3|nr:hypothetical protein [Paenibacillus vietnamensis]MCA0753982.1 hypothetical protein [Paenibacillus vietnamensis]